MTPVVPPNAETPTRPLGPAVDIDRHVQETWSMFGEYAEPEFRDRVYKRVQLPNGEFGLEIAGRLMPGWSAAMWADESANQFFLDQRFSPNRPEIARFDSTSYLETMDEEGVDVAILTPTLGLGNGSIPAGDVGSALCRAYTRWAKEFRSADPSRLRPLHPVNLYDVELAVRDARWAIETMGCSGLMLVALPVAGRALHAPEFDMFWKEAQDLGVPVQIHSVSSLPDSEGRGALVDLVAGASRLGGNPFLHHAVSHRVEPELAMLSLVAGGVLARFPRLRVAFSESGGGWVSSWVAAMDERYESPMRRWVPWLSARPSEYVREQCLIGFEAGEASIASHVKEFGAESVAWFSDYPHWDSVYPGAVEVLQQSLVTLSPRDQSLVIGGSALAFYGDS